MDIKFSFVPPGGGEQDYMLEVDLPAIPRAGDYFFISKEGETGQQSFLVRRTWWHVRSNDDRVQSKEIWVEAEFVSSPYDSDSHKRSIEMYAYRGKQAQEAEASGY